MIIEIGMVVSGLLIVLFIPGFLLSLVLFEKLRLIERISLSLGLSISIVVAVGFLLTVIGYSEAIRGITTQSIWFLLLSISAFFSVIFILTSKRK